tara:strand:- start:585 stop:935 length:351 start_codon:yes stop_codon:yes gene_type:complete
MQIAHVGNDELEVAASAVLHELRNVIAEFHAFLGREALTSYRWQSIQRWLKRVPSELDWLWEAAHVRPEWYLDTGLMYRMTDVCYTLNDGLEFVEHPPKVLLLVEKLKHLEGLVDE